MHGGFFGYSCGDGRELVNFRKKIMKGNTSSSVNWLGVWLFTKKTTMEMHGTKTGHWFFLNP